MKFYAVIDTNVIVSAMLKRNSVPWIIVNKLFDETIIPLANNEIIEEYEDVLSRKKFSFNKKDVSNFIKEFSKKAILLDRTKIDEQFVDLDDVVFYEIVITARKKSRNSYLITGNKKHFPIKSYIVTPNEMLEIIKK
ncbi:MAG: putative toxin-antitoxin system toxin component, PIN family [Candidatus Riflebacteria bacterium]|nr:putative toxin-antitoxin system toxin component, PIN family [Candidatus Riflebacteria bacterium]